MALAEIIVGLILLGVAGGIGYFSLDFIRSGINSINWPQGRGKIVRSSQRKQEDEDSTEYLADIEYEYEYQGNIYYGKDSRFLGSGKNEAKRNFEEYQPGALVDFYFDPYNPAKSVQYPGLQGTHYARMAIIALFAFMGLVFLFR